MPADSMTVYAAQGNTYHAVIADMEKPPNLGSDQHWLSCYVMLSRAKTLEGLLILRPALRHQLSRKPPQNLLDEMDRLQLLEHKTLDELVAYLNSLPISISDEVRTDVLAKNSVSRERKYVKEKRSFHVLAKDTVVREAGCSEAQGELHTRTHPPPPNRRLRVKTSLSSLPDAQAKKQKKNVTKDLLRRRLPALLKLLWI
jgi:hypothetical protein